MHIPGSRPSARASRPLQAQPASSNDRAEAELSRFAAEEVALQLGWLRECPYHGEPFRALSLVAEAGNVNAAPADTGTLSGCSPDVAHAAARLAEGYAEACPFCERENAHVD